MTTHGTHPSSWQGDDALPRQLPRHAPVAALPRPLLTGAGAALRAEGEGGAREERGPPRERGGRRRGRGAGRSRSARRLTARCRYSAFKPPAVAWQRPGLGGGSRESCCRLPAGHETPCARRAAGPLRAGPAPGQLAWATDCWLQVRLGSGPGLLRGRCPRRFSSLRESSLRRDAGDIPPGHLPEAFGRCLRDPRPRAAAPDSSGEATRDDFSLLKEALSSGIHLTFLPGISRRIFTSALGTRDPGQQPQGRGGEGSAQGCSSPAPLAGTTQATHYRYYIEAFYTHKCVSSGATTGRGRRSHAELHAGGIRVPEVAR